MYKRQAIRRSSRIEGGVAQTELSIKTLAPEVPACVAEARRVAEFIDGDPARRQAGRARFRTYKDRGWSPTTHNL